MIVVCCHVAVKNTCVLVYLISVILVVSL